MTGRPSWHPHPASRARRDAVRAGTVARIAEHLARELGRRATDAEVAALLARSVASVARLRRLAERAP